MGNEIELISDGQGVVIIGSAVDVERFIDAEELTDEAVEVPRLGALLRSASVAVQGASEIAANSGRWVKLTRESAEKVRKYGLMDTETAGVKHAMIGTPGDIKSWIQIVKSPTSIVGNPAALAGAAGVMAQLAMQQQMDEIKEYLAKIDEKLDDVLRAQTNQVLARMDGVDLAVREAMTVRRTVGRVSDVTWSKVQHASSSIFETQGYALRQLADLIDKVGSKSKLDDLVDAVSNIEAEVDKWLMVLARCVELHDAVAVIELERVLDSSPDELDRHRLGLQAARRDRLELLFGTTQLLLERMAGAAQAANAKVLLNPIHSPAFVRSANQVAAGVHEFHDLLGIEDGGTASETRRWKQAAGERWAKTREAGSVGFEVVKLLGAEAGGRVRSAPGKLSGRLARRKSGSIDEGTRSDDV